MHYLSIATIARGEDLYLEEWLTYHYGVGVDHVYLYDNGLKPLTVSTLKVIFTNKLTVIPFYGETMQTSMITTTLKKYRHASRWIAFTDVDEFLVPLQTNNLKLFLQPYERYSAVCPHWRLFGSSGERTYRDAPVVRRFTRCAKEVDRHIKSIVDPKRTHTWVTVHKCTHSSPAVDEHCRPIPDNESRPEPATADIIQLNHYVTKSYDECLERRSRPRADIKASHHMPEFFTAHDRNDIEHLRALELWNQIKGVV